MRIVVLADFFVDNDSSKYDQIEVKYENWLNFDGF